MAKVSEHLGDIEVPAKGPNGETGWRRTVDVTTTSNRKATPAQKVAAYTASIEAAFRAHQKLIRHILKEKPEKSEMWWPEERTRMKGYDFVIPTVGYIQILDEDGNGKWDWIEIGKAKMDDGRLIRTTRSVDLHAHLGYPSGRPLVEQAIDRSIRKLLRSLL